MMSQYGQLLIQAPVYLKCSLEQNSSFLQVRKHLQVWIMLIYDFPAITPAPEWRINQRFLKRIFAIFVTLLGYATLTQPAKRECWLYPVGRISVA